MSEKVLIFGKNTWPYTTRAREAYKADGMDVDYYDVIGDASKMELMLKYSDGARDVPVIVIGESVTIGFEGGS